MSGNYFGFSHTASHFSQPQQQQGTYGATHFTPAAAASPHTSYVVASTARPSAAAAYETTYTAQPAGQYYTATHQRQETHHQASNTAAYRAPAAAAAAAAAYTTYAAESTPSYEKQTYYQQPQAAAQQHQGSHSSATYYSAGGSATTGGAGGTAVRGMGKSTFTAYYQSGGNQQKGKSAYAAYYQGAGGQQKPAVTAKLPANYQSPAASFNQPKPTQPKQQQAASNYSGQQSYSSGGSYSGSSYGGNKKPTHQSGGNQQQQQQQQQGQYAGGHEGGSNEGYSYDAVVFSAASNYYQQQQRPNMGAGGSMKKTMNGQGGYKGPPRTQRATPKPSQLHYCAVCKISCAGPLTYKEHLEGQKHKKKEEAAKNTTPTVIKSSQPSYRCELCDVTCTGMDAYNAHIRGKNHTKVFKLHTRLGKPIPSTDPVKLNAAKPTEEKTASAAKKVTPAAKKPVTPKINFIAGSKFSSVPGEKQSEGTKPTETKAEEQEPAAAAEVKDNDSSNIQPVGEDYVEEIRNDDGKLISFNCKLCECRFNDPHAKNMHMKGRRHRLQYKSKVDPNLKVEAKPTLRNRRQMEDRMRRKMAKEEMMRRRDEEMRWRDQMRQYDEEMLWRQMEEERYLEGVRHHEEMFHEWMRRGGPRSGLPPPPRAPPFVELPSKRQENEIDRHVLAKHNSIYPKEQELDAVQNMVSTVERALKMVSDFLTESETPKDDKTEEKAEVKQEAAAEAKKEESKAPAEDANMEQKYRVMKGVMRVGVLAKGLLLANDLNMDLIVLCSEKPTRTLLERVFHCIPKQLPEITEEKFDLSLCVEEAAILLSVVINDCPMKMKVSLTSPVMRDPAAAETADATRDPPDVLDKEKCLAALAALRHAKWFQAKAAVLSSCVVVIRVLRDLCDRIPTWAPLKGWPIELICERVIASADQPLSPGDALRRVFEAIAGGLLLPGGPGIYDPCEREDTDVLDAMTPQQKEEITASAQHALRLIVFRQVHKVLNMEPLFSQRRRFNNRKRRRDDNETEQDGADGKKDKKEGGAATGSAAAAEGK